MINEWFGKVMYFLTACMWVSCLMPQVCLSAPPRISLNDDNITDLVIGVPYEDIGTVDSAGAVNVIHGSATGLTAAGNQIWYQDSGLYGISQDDDMFGYALCVGDFNGDGMADLAVGVPYETLESEGELQAGVVHVIYSSVSGGLISEGNQVWTRLDFPQRDFEKPWKWGTHFGYDLAAGDFNGDGCHDLAISAPGTSLKTGSLHVDGVGTIHILYGSKEGLSSTSCVSWHQEDLSLPLTSDASQLFGESLATGDFNRDGYADLAVGTPRETGDAGGVSMAGAIDIIYGSKGGLDNTRAAHFHQGDLMVGQPAADGDFFGWSLASGNFNGDHWEDLAVGAMNKDCTPGKTSTGAVFIIHGSRSGLTASGAQIWHQDIIGTDGIAVSGDQFGYSLASGDFDTNGCDDLAIGVVRKMVDGYTHAGGVHLIYGTTAGLTAAGDSFLDMNELFGTGTIQRHYCKFGFALATGDFDGNGHDDLAVGAPGHTVSGEITAGSVSVIYGGVFSPLSSAPAAMAEIWHQDITDMAGMAEAGDEFGRALAGYPPKPLWRRSLGPVYPILLE